MLTWLVATAALAQEPAPAINGQLFRPAIGSTRHLWTETTDTGPDGYATARTFFHYANRPLRVPTASGSEVLVGDVAALDLAGALHFRGMRIGAHVPLYGFTSSPLTGNQAGLGDMMLDLQGGILDRDEAPIGLALAGRLLLPTASVDAPLGARSTGWELAAIVDRAFGPVLLSANVGTRGVPREIYGPVVWDDQLFVRGGAGWQITERGGLSGELGAQTNWASQTNPAGTAAELVGGGWVDVADGLALRGGASVGLGRAPGTPVGRLLVGLSWQPNPFPDRDLDGVVDRDDWCPDEMEDVDGFEDADGCPDPTTTFVVQLTRDDGTPISSGMVWLEGPERREVDLADPVVTVHPGTYTVRAMAEGFEPLNQELVVVHEPGRVVSLPMVGKVGSLRIWAVDAAGKPLDATFSVSGDEVWPANGAPVSVVAGEKALVIRAPGHEATAVSLHVEHGSTREYSAVLRPSGAKEQVRVANDRIEIAQQVFFDLNKATIQRNSYALLDEVAAVILQNPGISRVRIEGHTDDQGPRGFNDKLSQQRADAVRKYLVGRGVDPARLRSVGYGPSRPLRRGDSEQDHSANRRVEFHLES